MVIPLPLVVPDAIAVLLAVVIAVCLVVRFFVIPTLHDALALARDRRSYLRENETGVH